MQHEEVGWRPDAQETSAMPILHVRNVPARLYGRLQALAKRNRRSLSAEILAQLESTIDREARREEQARLLDGINRRRDARGPRGTDSVAWIREDRDGEAEDRRG
jgi:hypothetical protein